MQVVPCAVSRVPLVVLPPWRMRSRIPWETGMRDVLQLTLPDPVKLFKADNQLYSSTEARDPILE